MEPEDDVTLALRPSHVGRALALMSVSVLALGIAALTYAHPQLSAGFAKQAATHAVEEASYRLVAIDFVSPSTGWVLAEDTTTFVILHTGDSGQRWSRQLAGLVGRVGEYVRFFDQSHGVVVVLGPQAQMFQTRDGGKTWSEQPVALGGGHIASADFIDAQHGWLLATTYAPDRSQTQGLFRTSDGGASWFSLGSPVLSTDIAYRAVFADPDRGWLYSRSAGAYAYKTTDGGVSWGRVALPAPRGSWPVAPAGSPLPEVYFVAARPTIGDGIAASVIVIAPPQGRSAGGGTVTGYPPLTVHAYDGGRPITYVYSMSGDTASSRYSGMAPQAKPGPVVTAVAENEVLLTSIDGGQSWNTASAPSPHGAIGYLDAVHWWWIGSGSWSKSSDGGRTWTGPRNIGVPEPLPGSLQLLDSSHAWFGGMAGARPLLESSDDGGIHWTMFLLPAAYPT